VNDSYPLSDTGLLWPNQWLSDPLSFWLPNGFQGWVALVGTPMAGVHQSDRTGIGDLLLVHTQQDHTQVIFKQEVAIYFYHAHAMC
jgi:hypothetical protein